MLPKTLLYQSKTESSKSRPFRSNIAPQNGTGNYGASDCIIINIPTRNNLFLVPNESYLKFSMAITNTHPTNANGYRWDSGGAHGIIQNIKVYSGSNLLSSIDSYGLLAKAMFDLQVSTDASYGKHNVLSGQRSDLMCISTGNVPVVADAATATVALTTNGYYRAVNTNTGDVLTAVAGTYGGTVANNGVSAKSFYCLNLISLVGTLCSQNYFPLCELAGSGPLRVEITLVDNLNKAMAFPGAGSTFQIADCEYVANLIELSDDAMNTIRQSLGGSPLQFVVPAYANYQWTQLLANNAQVSIPIACKYSSLKSLLTTSRDYYTVTAYFPHSTVMNGLLSYQYKIGPQLMPMKAPSCVPEHFAEVLKAVGSMSDILSQPSIDLFSYSMNASLVNAAADIISGVKNSGSFYVGLDTEVYSNASKSDFFCGLNTNNDDCSLILQYGTVANAVNMRYDTFAMYDSLLVFENGTCYSKQ